MKATSVGIRIRYMMYYVPQDLTRSVMLCPETSAPDTRASDPDYELSSVLWSSIALIITLFSTVLRVSSASF